MAHNFLAEIPEFFLSDGELKSFESLPQGDPNFGLVQQIPGGLQFGSAMDEDPIPMEYKMRIVMGRLTSGTKKEIWSNGVYVTPPQDYDPDGTGELRERQTMYSRPSAFGPPSWDHYYAGPNLGLAGVAGNDNRNGYNFPFTPPYYHGDAWADITFVPGRIGKHTLDEIIASSPWSIIDIGIQNQT